MKSITKTIRVALSLLIIASALIAPRLVNAFQEGWESSPIGTYAPDNLPLPLIPADEGDWLLGDTVSEFPECGSTPHTAEILLSGGNRSLRLTSNDSSSGCADNVWVNLFEVPQLNLNPGFSVPLTPGTIISFEETGNLTSPETGSPYCVFPPCGDTVSLTLEDNRGNMLAYVLQRAPDAVPNEVHSFYREVFLDPNAGVYSRNLFADFNTIPDFNPSEATIRTVAFEVSEHGTATIDNICIGTSGCVPPSLVTVPDVEGLTQSAAEAAIVAASLSVGTVTTQTSNTVPAGSVISQAPSAGTEVTPGTEVDLVVSAGILNSTEFKILPSDGAGHEYFGHRVSISGNYAIVGAYGDDDNGTNSGSAYIFERSGSSWNQVAKLTASDGAAGDCFGYAVSISGDYAIVGAYNDDDNGTNSGSAYVFERSGSSWNQVAKLTASDGAAGDQFGMGVSISGDYAIVGAWEGDGNEESSGSAYIFERSGSSWNQVAKLTASDGAAYDYFGIGVSISGDYAIVGAYNDDDNGLRSGSAYIFEKSGSSWNQVVKLTASDGAASDLFGPASISGDYAIVGAWCDDDNGENSGSAYIFHLSIPDGVETGCLITSDLWIRSVINTEEKGPIEAVWQKGGEDTTSRGDRVIWGHFYASPSDVTWGSQNNPDLFVKIWFDVSGRVDVNYFHVSVPDIEVYSDYPYDGTPDEQGTTTMSRRYIRQYYENGQSYSDENYEDGNPPSGYSPAGNPFGYSTINDLKIGSMINTVERGPIDALWRLGGQDTTSRGDQVVWGHFYASPNDVTWGSQDNPDLFVKIWFDVSGRVDVNYFHVSVPDIEVYSDLPHDGTYDQQGTTIMDNRYIRHEYHR